MSAKYRLTFSALEIRTVRELLDEFPEFKESYSEFYTEQCVNSKEICLDFVYWRMLLCLLDCYYDCLCDTIDSIDKGMIPYKQRGQIVESIFRISNIADKISAALE